MKGMCLGFQVVEHNWLELHWTLIVVCEAFSTYPRTYDLIHANRLFSLYKDKRACRCSYEDILIEMDRILRPEGTSIIRGSESEVMKVKIIISGMKWNTKMVDSEDGPLLIMFSLELLHMVLSSS
ncbi:hypothetical protein L1987_39670 [Smallanthus sonchifolius]|uniref:Uncharacterized protein n=1 Tax=Smallanthus sonchifolius TaxID=185202 RepID=A0ACB9HNT8_9ASTR|nr:hypothetical protein L1987_39670 [Smallanthus sonchifolius]